MIGLVARLAALMLLAIGVVFPGYKSYVAMTTPMKETTLAVQRANPDTINSDIEIPELSVRPLQAHEALYSRQILFRNRKFVDGSVAAEPGEIEPAQTDKLEIKVLGIVGRRQNKQALMQIDASEPLWYEVGDAIGSYKLAEIGDDNVVVERKKQLRTIKLYQN